MRLSKRSALASAKHPLAAALAERRARGLDVLDLRVMLPAHAGLGETVPSITPDALREALAAHTRAPAESIVLAPSRGFAMAALLEALCDPGDEVLVPAPCEPALAVLASLSSVALRHAPLAREDDGFRIDALAIYEAIGDRTRAVLTGHPLAPAGALLDASTLEAMTAMELPIIIDASFAEHLLAEPDDPADPTATHEAMVATLGDLANLGAAPESAAWIALAGPADLTMPLRARVEAILEAHGAPTRAVQLPSSTTRAAIRARVLRNERVLRRALEGSGTDVPRIDAGLHALIRIEGASSDVLALEILERGVLVEPGSAYHFHDRSVWLVLSLLTPEPTFDEGVARILDALRSAGRSQLARRAR